MGTQIRGIHTHADIHNTQAWIKNIEGGTVIVSALLLIIFVFQKGF